MTVIAITGHRPEDLPNQLWARETLTDVLEAQKPTLLIQGMAAGADLMSARIAWRLGIPFLAVRPWAGHEPRKNDEKLYQWALDTAVEVVTVSDALEYEGPWVYENRNRYMIDRADKLVAVWTGKKTGGTANAVKYAQRTGKPLIHIDPAEQVVNYPEPTLF